MGRLGQAGEGGQSPGPSWLGSGNGVSSVPAMRAFLVALLVALVSLLRPRASLHLEILALRHQLAVLHDGGRRPRHCHRWRCHQSLEMDCPEPRAVQPPEVGEVVEGREASGLYRHYE